MSNRLTKAQRNFQRIKRAERAAARKQARTDTRRDLEAQMRKRLVKAGFAPNETVLRNLAKQGLGSK